MIPRPLRVLIVDDSAMGRRVLSIGLGADPELEVVGTASNAETALALLRDLRPDVVTLDIEMPEVNGVELLRRYMPATPTPTVVISGHARQDNALADDALRAGAVDVITKPRIGAGDGLMRIMEDIRNRVKAAALTGRARAGRSRVRARLGVAPAAGADVRWLLAIGASTGGVQALGEILPRFGADAPAIVIVQHMPGGFTAAFADRLNASCGIDLREAADGDPVEPGVALLAPGGMQHMTVSRVGGRLRVNLIHGPQVCYSRPSIDVLFRSVARTMPGRCSAALLTGMGRDGAEGLCAIRQSGGRTVAQDEATSVVFGMPLAAWELGAAEQLVPLGAVTDWLMRSVGVPGLRGALHPTGSCRT